MDINYNPIYSKWDPERIREYKSNFELEKYIHFTNLLESITINGPDQEGVNKALNELCTLYLNPALKMKISKPYTKRKDKEIFESVV